MSCSPQHERSPLYVAAKKGHTDVVDVLVPHGANTNTLDSVRNLMDKCDYILLFQICIYNFK